MTTYAQSTLTRLSLHIGDVSIPVFAAYVAQGEFLHEMARVSLFTSANSSVYRAGTPVRLTYGVTPRKIAVFLGYVSHTTPSYETNSRRDILDIYCVGPTFNMKNTSAAVFKNATVTDSIRKIAGKYRLSTALRSSSYLWPSLSQGSVTDWQFLVELAKREGYALVPHQTIITALPRTASDIRQRSKGAIPVVGTGRPDKSIITFVPEHGAESSGGGQLATRQLQGIDPRHGSPFFATTTATTAPNGLGRTTVASLFTKDETALPVANISDANATLAGISGNNQMFMEATLECYGDPAIRPGRLLIINGTIRSDGYWYVKEATHTVLAGAGDNTEPWSTSKYTTKAVLGRDSEGASVAAPVQLFLNPNNPSGADQVPPSTLINGQWTSAWNGSA